MNFQQPYYNQRQNKPKNYNDAYFNSIPQLLNWASSLLDLEITSIDQMVTGAIFCQLLDACHPRSVLMNNINWKANCETEYISNFKIFQKGLNKNNIEKTIDINRLAKGKQSELNELLQWIYGYYTKNKDNYNEVYNAKKKRNGQNFVFKNNIKQKFRKKKFIKDNNYTQKSSSSHNYSECSDTDSQIDNFSNYNFNFNDNQNNFSHSRSKDYIRYNNNLHNRYNINNNYPNSQFQNDERMRNRSKQNVKNENFYGFEGTALNNNYSNNSYNNNIFYKQNKRNINNSSKPRSLNNN